MNKSFSDIDSYIAAHPGIAGEKLEKVRKVIKKTVPDAVEVISYGMPAFKYHGMLAWFAAFKNHYSVFVRPKNIIPFKKDLQRYELSKSAIRIPLDKPVPAGILAKIIEYSAKNNLDKAQSRKKG